jgi:predicted alpha/beta superfamily hydrolase
MLRINELTPWSNEKYGGGDGDLYMQFIVETLKPEIDKRYRTLPDAKNTAIFGSSLGGLVSVYGGLKYNNTFEKIGAFSPSFWYSDSIYAFVENENLSVGTRILLLGSEMEDSTMVPDIQKMEALLEPKLQKGQLKVIGTTDGAHSEWYWKREFPEAIVWLMELKRE